MRYSAFGLLAAAAWLGAGCASGARPGGGAPDGVEARAGASLLDGKVHILSGDLVREDSRVRYHLVLSNVTDSPVRLKARVRFFDAAGVEYRKGEDRWESRTIAAGGEAEIAGVFTMPDPTRLSVTVLSE